MLLTVIWAASCEKGLDDMTMWFRVIGTWNHLLKMVVVIGFSFKERFLWFQLFFLDFYHIHLVIWGMKWAKKLKTENGQNMSSGPFSHDAAHFTTAYMALKQYFPLFSLIPLPSISIPVIAFHTDWPDRKIKGSMFYAL